MYVVPGSQVGVHSTQAWKNGQSWVGITSYMGYNQDAYGAECAALACALEAASRRQTTPERVTISTDGQAAIRRMASEDPDPGQIYALQERKHIATMRGARPNITIEVRWRPVHKRGSRKRGGRIGPGSQQKSQMAAGWNG